MEDEDDVMVLLVVGDEDTMEKNNMLCSTIKEELLYESEIAPVEEVLEAALKHGEVIKIKEEEEVDDPEYLKEIQPADTTNSDDSGSNQHQYRKKRIFTPKTNVGKHKPVSYVRKLCNENPELDEHPFMLIEHLANIMKLQIIPPEPPANFCTIKYFDGEKKFVCNTCYGKDDSAGAAARHYQMFHGERYLMCYACGVDFTNTTNLYKHEKRCKAPDAEIVLQARGRYLGLKGRARRYTKLEPELDPKLNPNLKPKKRLQCPLCPASFADKRSLLAHAHTHAGVRPYRCHVCDAGYTNDFALKRHLEKHGEGMFICDICGRDFKSKRLLVTHMHRHLPERKYTCGHCWRQFTEKTALKHHVNTKHLHLPPEHACPVCPRRFAQLKHVKSHMQRIHGLSLITKKMFYQASPNMLDTPLQEAKVVLHSEIGQNENIFENHKTETVPIEYTPTKVNKQERTKLKDKGVYQIKLAGKKEVYEVSMDKEDNPDSTDEFIKFISSVKPGSELVKVKDYKDEFINFISSVKPKQIDQSTG